MKKLMFLFGLFFCINTLIFTQTWTQQTSGTIRTLLAVSFIDANNGLATGNNSTILKTTNGGQDWLSQYLPSYPEPLNVKYINTNVATITGQDGKIFRTTDGGANWVAQTSGTTQPLRGIDFVDVNNGWIVGQQGVILRTTNGGTNWTQQNSGVTVPLWCVDFTDINTGTATGGNFPNGVILRTSDGGQSWTQQTNNSQYTIYGVSFTSNSVGYAVADFGTILKTINGGQNWVQLTPPITASFRGVSFCNENNGAIVDLSGIIIRTTDGGQSWLQDNRGITLPLFGISMVNANLAWAVGGSGTILKYGTGSSSSSITVTAPNGGENVTVGSTATITWTSSNVSNVKIEYTTDNGSTWQTIISSYSASVGSYSITIPNTPSTQCKIKISDASNASINDMSDNVFTISTVTSSGGLIAYYPFNGNANDESGNGRNGVVYGATLTTDRFGNPNKAYQFNGTSNYIDIPGTNNLHLNSGELTLAAWINFTESNDVHAIVGKHIAGYGNGYYIMVRPATKIEFLVDSDYGLRSTESYNDGAWHFVVGTFDGSMMKLYIDGELKSSQTKTYSSQNDSTITIGKHHAGVKTDFFIGKIDDIRIYNRPLTDLEVLMLYTATSSPSITVTSPNGGEKWESGTSKNITWSSSIFSNVMIEYTTNNGSNWNGIATSQPASIGSYSWTVPSVTSTECKVKISDASNTSINDISDNVFGISNQPQPQASEWAHYTNCNNINDILNDGNYLWIASNGGGVVRFDKTTGERIFYTPANTEGKLPSYNVTSVTKDASGNKWFSCWEGGLAKFDGTTWTVWKPNSGLTIDWRLKQVAVDNSGNKWIVNVDGLHKFDETNWTSYPNSQFSGSIYCIAIDGNNIKWVGTDNGLWKFDTSPVQNWNQNNSQIPSNHIYRIALESGGTKWLGTLHGWLDNGAGVAKFDGTTFTTYASFDNNGIRSIYIDNNNIKWIGLHDGGGLAKYDGSTWTIYKPTNSNIPHSTTFEITGDNSGNIWMGGTYNHWGGDPCLVKYDGSTFTKYYLGIAGSRVNNIFIETNGNKWVSTPDGLTFFNGNNWANYNTNNSSLPTNDIRDCRVDANEIKWIATSNGLVKYDGTNWTVYQTNNSGIPYNGCISIAFEGTTKWVGLHNPGSGAQGVVKFDGTNWINYNTSNSNIANNAIWKIVVDASNNKWIATDGGLSRFDGSNWINYTTSNSQIPNNVVRTIAIDNNNVKWVGTFYGGLGKLDGSNWTKWTTADGMPQNDIYSLAIDNSGNKWLGYYWYGAAKFDGTTFYKISPSTSPLAGDAVSIFIEPGGTKWFGTTNGLNSYTGEGIVGIKDERQELLTTYLLKQNYPNPFNPNTKISYTIPKESYVKLSIFNLLGELVAMPVNEIKQAGNYAIDFNAGNLNSGIYFYRIETAGFMQAKKMLLLK